MLSSSLACLDDSVLFSVLRFADGKTVAHLGAASRGLRAKLGEGFGSSVWEALCEGLGYRQSGTRTRGRLPWRSVYYANLCVECHEPGTVFVNDRALSWPNARFALCDAHVRSQNLCNVARRPEIGGDKARLRHVLFRIATVRRELGFTSNKKKKRRSY